MSWKQRNGDKKEQFQRKMRTPEEIQAQEVFDQLKAKLANAIVYLLVSGIQQSELRTCFEQDEKWSRRYQAIKRFRTSLIDARPNAKQWINKAFYIGLKLGPVKEDDLTGQKLVQLIQGDTIFKQTTKVISSVHELDRYIETIGKIIDSEKIWADPDMVDFDIGERGDDNESVKKKKKQKLAERAAKQDDDAEESKEQVFVTGKNTTMQEESIEESSDKEATIEVVPLPRLTRQRAKN